MTKAILSILFISAILITGAIAASVDLTQFAEAAVGKGVLHTKVGSAGSVVCGDRLCSAPAPAPAPAPEPEEAEPAPVPEEAEPAPEPEEAEPAAEPDEAGDEITIEEATTVEKAMEMKPHDWITATGTIQSMLDPGIGHETHQIVILLPPSD